MENFLKKEMISNLITSIVLLIVGVILINIPIDVINLITYVIEVVLIVSGIITIINYLRVDVKYDIFSLGFVQGLSCILIALFLILNPGIIMTILPITLGIWMIFGSLTKLQVVIKLSSLGQKASIVHIIFTILMFTVGIICLCNPFKTGEILIQMLGYFIAIYSLFDIIEGISAIMFINKQNKLD